MVSSNDREYARAYMRKWRRRKGLVKGPRAPLPTEAELEKRGKELAMLEQLPMLDWPTDLFTGQNLTVAQLMADGDFKAPKIGRVTTADKCACGCGLPHNNGASTTRRNALGNRVGHNVPKRVNGKSVT